MINLHIGRQTSDYDCGAMALQLVMAYYGVDVRGDRLMEALGTGKDGTRVSMMISVAESYGFDVFHKSNWKINELKDTVEQGYPVIVLVQAWAERYLTQAEWRKNYNDGHYVVVIGFSKGVIMFEDPASFRRTWLTEREFLARWHDRNDDTGVTYDRFGMVLKGKEPSEKKFEHMD